MKKALFLLLLLCSAAYGNECPGTVVGIHGFMVTSRTMLPLRKALRAEGFNVYLWNYPSRARTCQEHACHLVRYLQFVAAQRPGEPIHFVAHSIGSWILRAALNFPGCPEEAKCSRIVLLAPPNQGISLARKMGPVFPFNKILGDKLGREMICYDACDIQRLGSFPSTNDVFIITGTHGIHAWFDCRTNDGYVAVDETYLETPYLFKTLPLVHGQLLQNRYSLRMIRTFLLGC